MLHPLSLSGKPKFYFTKATTFLLSRHPFDRLISAFREKLEQCHGALEGKWKDCKRSSKDHYQEVGKEIVNKYRKKSLKMFGEEFFDKR